MKKVTLAMGALVTCLILSSCESKTAPAQTTTENLETNQANIIQLVEDWNQAHVHKDLESFNEFYDEMITYYGSRIPKSDAIEDKQIFFNKNPDYYQQIFGEVNLENLGNQLYKAHFIKRVTRNGATTDYPSYLIVQSTDKNFKIVTEGDLVTDKNLKNKKAKTTTDANQREYYYSDKAVNLKGTLKIESYYGPPGYGETPEIDTRQECYVLHLDHSINLNAEVSNNQEGEFERTLLNVEKIQLTASDIKLGNFVNKHIQVSGSFFPAHTGYHRTDVLMDVSKVNSK